jgi:ATP-dependent protease ClpP protease subunit
MPNWNSVLREISVYQAEHNESAFDTIRRKYLKRLYAHTGRNVIAYYSGFLSKPRIEGTQINDEDKNGFMLCIHELKRNQGLDLILHTPGGDGAAAESLVDYLRSMFGTDVRAIVPQIAMSAGTMIACSCKSIVMGKESSLGPVDPQYGAISAVGLLKEVKRAHDEILKNNQSALFWNPILQKITPSFLQRCEWAVLASDGFIRKTLAENMLARLDATEQKSKIESICEILSNLTDSKEHNTHFQIDHCKKAGLEIVDLEADQKLQDLVLTLHHCYMHTLSNTPALKVIENHLGRAMVRVLQPQLTLVPAQQSTQGAAALS